MDYKPLKEKYKFKEMLKLVNEFLPMKDRKEMLHLEAEELDKWWWEYGHYKDFSRYYTPIYLATALNCFDKYSKGCALYAHMYLHDKKIDSIVDYGAGIGLSTNLLQDLFPKAKVYYFNIDESTQKQFFVKNKDPRIEIVNLDKLISNGPYSMLFASELFEHIEKPINLYLLLKEKIGFDYLVINNSFTAKAYGHFAEYEHDGKIYNPKEMSKLWLKEVRKDYNDMKTQCWNNRPKFFVKKGIER